MDIVQELNSQLPRYLKHAHITKHQQGQLKLIQKNLKTNEVMIVVDFSKNYNCKYANEVQSTHFGASKKQISLHTGVFS